MLLKIISLLSATAIATTTPTTLPIETKQEVRVEQQAELTSTSSVRDYVEREAIKKGIDPELVTSIVNCESGYIPRQSEYITRSGKREESWGIWQIHLPSNPDVSKDQAMDIEWSTKWSLQQIKEGKPGMWSCYKK